MITLILGSVLAGCRQMAGWLYACYPLIAQKTLRVKAVSSG